MPHTEHPWVLRGKLSPLPVLPVKSLCYVTTSCTSMGDGRLMGAIVVIGLPSAHLSPPHSPKLLLMNRAVRPETVGKDQDTL